MARRPVKVTGCAECPFAGGDSAGYCRAVSAARGGRMIPLSVNVDSQRPRWCPLPLVVQPARGAVVTGGAR